MERHKELILDLSGYDPDIDERVVS